MTKFIKYWPLDAIDPLITAKKLTSHNEITLAEWAIATVNTDTSRSQSRCPMSVTWITSRPGTMLASDWAQLITSNTKKWLLSFLTTTFLRTISARSAVFKTLPKKSPRVISFQRAFLIGDKTRMDDEKSSVTPWETYIMPGSYQCQTFTNL